MKIHIKSGRLIDPRNGIDAPRDLFIAAGNLERIFRVYLPQVKEYARENGCCALTSVSRRGFLKKFPPYGFKPKSVAFELELKD